MRPTSHRCHAVMSTALSEFYGVSCCVWLYLSYVLSDPQMYPQDHCVRSALSTLPTSGRDTSHPKGVARNPASYDCLTPRDSYVSGHGTCIMSIIQYTSSQSGETCVYAISNVGKSLRTLTSNVENKQCNTTQSQSKGRLNLRLEASGGT